MLPDIIRALCEGCDFQDLLADDENDITMTQIAASNGQVTFETLLEQLPSFPGWNTGAMIHRLQSIWNDLHSDLHLDRQDGIEWSLVKVNQFKLVLTTLKLAYKNGQDPVELRRTWEHAQTDLGL